MPDLSWLTSTTAPWWAALGAPIFTFWLGQHFANSGAAAQRTDDLADREKERTANLAAIDKQLAGERLKGKEERTEAAASQRDGLKRDAFAEALDAIAKLQAALVLSAADPEWGEPDANGSSKIVKDAPPVSQETLQAFISSMNRLRLFDGDKDFDTTRLTNDVSNYMAHWTVDGPDLREADPMTQQLEALSNSVSGAYRVRHSPT